jgi:hypothetical protein
MRLHKRNGERRNRSLAVDRVQAAPQSSLLSTTFAPVETVRGHVVATMHSPEVASVDNAAAQRIVRAHAATGTGGSCLTNCHD